MSVVGNFLPPDVSLAEGGIVGDFVRTWTETQRGQGFVYYTGFIARDRADDDTIDRLARLVLTLALPRGTRNAIILDLGLDNPPMGVACVTQRRLAKGSYEYIITKRRTRAVIHSGVIRREALA